MNEERTIGAICSLRTAHNDLLVVVAVAVRLAAGFDPVDVLELIHASARRRCKFRCLFHITLRSVSARVVQAKGLLAQFLLAAARVWCC